VKRVLKEEEMYDVLTKRVDEQPYVSRSKRVRIRELVPFILEGFNELGDAEGGQPFVLYHGAVTTEDDGPVEVCMPKTSADKRLPAGEVAFTEIRGSQCDFPEILGAYEAVFRWAKEHGREVDGPAREIYRNGMGEELHMEIAVPLR
jgi:effector-binding domain-containing protein